MWWSPISKSTFRPPCAPLLPFSRKSQRGHYVDLSGEPDTVWFQDLLKSAPALPAPMRVGLDETACLLYTGGTTGTPKGAELTHRNLLVNAIQCQVWLRTTTAGEVVLAALPFSHSYGMTTCLNHAIYAASTLVLIPNPRDLKFVLTNIARHKPTLFPGVPTMYVAINNYRDIEKYDLSSIRACISGGAGLPLEVQRRFEALTGGKLVEGYGLTECSPVTHANPVYAGSRNGTIGLPWPGTECRLVDVEDGQSDAAPGEPGELCIRGPQVMKGYWNRPEDTAAVLRDGWLHTGDVAAMDDDGYFRIVDRKKDMIIAGGYNIYPRDIEEVLYEHPSVREAVAVGVPHPYRGETAKAYVVLKEGATAGEDELIRWCRGRLAKYKVPTAIEIRDELPKTMVGKVLRRALREQEIARQARDQDI